MHTLWWKKVSREIPWMVVLLVSLKVIWSSWKLWGFRLQLSFTLLKLLLILPYLDGGVENRMWKCMQKYLLHFLAERLDRYWLLRLLLCLYLLSLTSMDLHCWEQMMILNHTANTRIAENWNIRVKPKLKPGTWIWNASILGAVLTTVSSAHFSFDFYNNHDIISIFQRRKLI